MCRVLVTGGLGFIGSHLVERLVNDDKVKSVMVMDNQSTGFLQNINFSGRNKIHVYHFDLRNYKQCELATDGVDYVFHQAALGSVPRSVKDPISTYESNVMGTLNLLQSCVKNKVKRVVFASSSSVYGDNPKLPKKETYKGNPLSPYAASKMSVELLFESFGRVYNLPWIGLRYFNVYGPKQTPNSQYSAVIPLFCKSAANDTPININGSEDISRDFTYVSDVVDANMLSMFWAKENALGKVFNISGGRRIKLGQIIDVLREITDKNLEVNILKPRSGDIEHSEADISLAKDILGYNPSVPFLKGILKTYKWIEENE